MSSREGSPASHRLSLALAAGAFLAIFIAGNNYNARQIVGIPLVLVRLLFDHQAALVPAAGATIVFLFALLCDRRESSSRSLERAVHVLLFLFGVSTLIWFLPFRMTEWGLGPDWNKDWQYYRAIQDAIGLRQMPYYLATAVQGSERLFANLEAPLSPDTLLLAVLPIPAFYAVRLAACFAVGYWAALRLKDQLQLSTLWFATWVVLFVLNGHILSHLGAGHTPWAGYFLVPLVFLALIKMETASDRRAMMLLAASLGAMLVLGSLHIFVWSLIFSLTFAALRPSLIGWILRACALAAALAAYRIAPAVATFGGGANAFAGSYPSASSMIDGIVGTSGRSALGIHEYDLFLGWVGLAMLILAVVPFQRRDRSPMLTMTIASAVMLALSTYNIYEATLFRLPGFVSQRVATRLAVLGVLGLLLAASQRLSLLLPRARLRLLPVAAAVFGASAWLAVQLALHAEGLRPTTYPAAMPSVALKNMPVEPSYQLSVWSGIGVSVIALLFVLQWVWRRWYDRADHHDNHAERRSA